MCIPLTVFKQNNFSMDFSVLVINLCTLVKKDILEFYWSGSRETMLGG